MQKDGCQAIGFMVTTAGRPTELPRYKSHKTVWALKIRSIAPTSDGYVLMFERDEFGSLAFTLEELQNRPKPEPGWYYVVYPDGYFSFSPAKQFEEGYTSEAPQDFKERLKQEFDELRERMEKLGQFSQTERFAALPEMDKQLLDRQAKAMLEYRDVLQMRYSRLHSESVGAAGTGLTAAVPEMDKQLLEYHDAASRAAQELKAQVAGSAADPVIEAMFTYHAPNQEQQKRLEALREAAKRFAYALTSLVPQCADKAAAIRKLREAVMTANAAIVLDPYMSTPMRRPTQYGSD